MIDDIRFDKLSTAKIATESAVTKKDDQTEKQTVSAEIIPTEGVTVKNHLHELVSLLNQGDTIKAEDLQVAAAKSLVTNGKYKVDLDNLADKLLTHGLINMGRSS